MAVLVGGLACVAVGTIEMVAWWARVTSILLWPVNSPPMVFNVALGFVLTGVGFICLTARWRVPAIVAGGLVMTLAVLALAEHALNHSLGIDELFATAYLNQPGAVPGRMAANAAVCLGLTGAALVVAATARGMRGAVAISAMGSLVAAVAALALLGHATATTWAYTWVGHVSMALEGAVTMLVVALTLLVLAAERAPRHGEWLALPASAAAFMLGAALWFAVVQREERRGEFSGPAATRAGVAQAVLTACLVGLTTWLALRAQRGRRLAEAESARRAEAEAALHESQARLAARAAELEAANRELDRSNADLQLFAYAASHDLAEPLRAIAMPLTLLAQNYKGRELDETGEELIDFAVSGSNRMQDMIDALLRYSRVGRLEGALGPVDAQECANRAVTRLLPILDASRAKVIVEQLPVVRAEPDQLTQVFQNLITNAVKFVDPGVVAEVVVAAAPADGCWRFTVTDNGIGVPAAHRQRVFTMFTRLQPREDYPGTGMGLALVKRIVERHGGEVGVYDAPSGHGSQFWFTLPASEEPPM